MNLQEVCVSDCILMWIYRECASDYILMWIYRDFVYVCSDALELNGTLITTEQKEYHESLAAGFQDIVDKLSDMLEEKVKVVLESLIINQFATCHFLMHLYTENFFSIL